MVYFLSDSHLGAGYIDNPKEQERVLSSWLDSIADNAEALYLLGDIIDYWFEYRNVVPRGCTRFLGSLARLADRGVKIVWLKGNHDIWMTDYLTSEIGCEVVDGVVDATINGKRFVMEHGDGVGRRPFGFRFLRRLFRNSMARILYAAIHPRWTVGFAHAWSRRSRKRGGYSGGARAVKNLTEWAEDFVNRYGYVDFFIFGHLHHPVQENVPGGALLTVLGDSFRQMSYAYFDGTTVELRTIIRSDKE
ncbi:MAG: UDP-2,3-diacylglucosamine diphosphatase [Bacteroides sp.]|nr:UDP-2,3-diacylglucosamine diphosphatase [Bacteroides sp.]